MKPLFRNIIAVIAGWLLGSIINMGLVTVGHAFFPIPGVDPDNMEEMAAIIGTLEFKFFIFPFLAHALGTFTGAVSATLIGATHKMKLAIGIGVIFLIGGIFVSFLLPAPTWFIVVDLLFAYIPMAWLGGKLVTGKTEKR
ncbi:MAG: hypothetical protein SCALA702_17860 [Melioribacteraceae bacterium]|nr:MAG: hypothetical protein SCALA702_17860 [Melioribacteraceae bacterium]